MKTYKRYYAIIFLLFLSIPFAKSQNPDLPNPLPNIQNMPAGSLVIAMDNTNQANPGYFNLKSYGLVITLLNADKKLHWVIKTGKAKDAADFSVNAEKLFPGFTAAAVKIFKAGPLVIFAADTAGTASVINSFNTPLKSANRVNVYRTTEPVAVDIRYDLFSATGISYKPKAAILDDGGNQAIHMSYMVNASIPVANYSILSSATLLMENCYTFASEPHNDGTHGAISAIVDSITHFVKVDGGNFLAECHAIETYENDQQGFFQSTQGFNAHANVKITNNVFYANPDLAYAQFEGFYNPNQGGYTQTYYTLPNSDTANHFYPVIKGNISTLDTIYGASVSKFKTGKGGLVFYLGNHDMGNGTSVEELNGQRMYMNAFLMPAAYPSCPATGPLAVELISFTGRKINNRQAQLYWTTANEYNSKAFVIERSAEGLDFTAINSVDSHGNTTSENNYTVIDASPLNGKNFYRLAEISTNGRVTYSNTIVLNFSVSTPSVEIFPNPVLQTLNLYLNDLPLSNNAIAVFDMTGKRVISYSQVSGNTVKIDLGRLTPGIYILNLITATGITVQKRFVIARN
jgi:hypothetical protein